jgi:hypothetical protein
MTTMKTTLVALMTLLPLPVTVLAQPAPINNPVVARMPCSMGAPALYAGADEARAVRVSHDDRGAAVYAPEARPAVQGGWARDVRRDIAHGFRGLCD